MTKMSHGARVYAKIGASCLAVLLASCGAAPATGNEASSQSASTMPGGPTQLLVTTPPPKPTSVIVTCGLDGSLNFLSSSNGSVLKSLPGIRTTSGFQGTGLVPAGLSGVNECGDGTFNRALTRIAGIHSINVSENVPAYYDIATGEVVDVVAPTDLSGFGSVQTKFTSAVAFSAFSDEIWYTLASSDDYSAVTVVGPNYSKMFDFAGATGGGCNFIFNSATSGPSIYCGYNSPDAIINGEIGSPETDPNNPQYLSPDALPDTDRYVSRVKLSDDGQSAAFLENNLTSASTNTLWIIPSIGADPVRLAEVPDSHVGIVRIGTIDL